MDNLPEAWRIGALTKDITQASPASVRKQRGGVYSAVVCGGSPVSEHRLGGSIWNEPPQLRPVNRFPFRQKKNLLRCSLKR